MRAVFYHVGPVGWLTCKWLKHLWPGCVLSRLGGVSVRRVDPPELVGDDWVRIRTLLGGVCGSDLAVLAQRHPPGSILHAYSSMPLMLGHENVGVVSEAGPGVDKAWVGKRVCVEPTLCCSVRGIDPPCHRCEAGQFGACENFGAAGEGSSKLPAGTSIGYNCRTGGSWGKYFVAHVSQLVPVPDQLSDAQGVLTDVVACGLHAVLRADVAHAKRVLVYGAGTLGLTVTASLRAIDWAGRIDLIGRYDYQGLLGRQLGADEVVSLPSGTAGRFGRIAELTGGTVKRARFGNYMLSGGYDVVFDCVGSQRSVEESLKWTRARGKVMLVGTGVVQVDSTPIWFGQLEVIGAWGRQMENLNGRTVSTYELAHELMLAGKLDVADLLTHTFRIDQCRRALSVALNKAPHRAVKVAFDFR